MKIYSVLGEWNTLLLQNDFLHVILLTFIKSQCIKRVMGGRRQRINIYPGSHQASAPGRKMYFIAES